MSTTHLQAVQQNPICAICYESITVSQKKYTMHPGESVAHIFHLLCAQDHLSKNSSCPLCHRSVVNLSAAQSTVIDNIDYLQLKELGQKK